MSGKPCAICALRFTQLYRLKPFRHVVRPTVACDNLSFELHSRGYLKSVRPAARLLEVEHVKEGKPCNLHGRTIKWPALSGRDMVGRRFSDGVAVKDYITRKVWRSSDVCPANRELYIEWAHSLLAESLSFSRVLKSGTKRAPTS